MVSREKEIFLGLVRQAIEKLGERDWADWGVGRRWVVLDIHRFQSDMVRVHGRGGAELLREIQAKVACLDNSRLRQIHERGDWLHIIVKPSGQVTVRAQIPSRELIV